MSRLEWDNTSTHLFETGVDRGVFYPSVGPGVPWNGLTSINETAEEAGTTILYVDGDKVHTQISLGTYAADLAAVTYPREFELYDGYSSGLSGQARRPFGLSYRTKIGNDVEGVDFGYKIHLVYNATATPTNSDHASTGSSPDILNFTWSLSTVPIAIDGAHPTSHLIIDTTMAYPSTVLGIENILYGTGITNPRFPTVQEVLDLFEANAIFKVTDHGDGIATVSGPDEAVRLIFSDTARLTWPSVVQMDEDTYNLSSL